MSRKLLAFLLSELETVRLICKNPKCGAVVEVPIERLSSSSVHDECRVCGAAYGSPGDPGNPLALLARAIRELKPKAVAVDVEFVLPDHTEEK